ncbi:unnamed protein product [Oreochromis niloticus]|nr:unnamed protein product [Mustela putorius furo]
MAAADFSRTRGPASARGLFLIFSLLCLISVSTSLNTEEQLMLEQMKTAIKEAERWKAENKYRKETITKLFDLSSSLNNKEPLKLFKETVHKGIKEEQRVKAQFIYRIATSGFEEMLENYAHRLEMVTRLLPDSKPLKEIVNICLHMMMNLTTIINKKMSLLQK